MLWGPSHWSIQSSTEGTGRRSSAAWAPVANGYKELIGDGEGAVLDEELFIASPFDTNPSTSLMPVIASGSWGEATIRRTACAAAASTIYPEPGGVMCWGNDGGGAVYYWDTSG